ncbi:hypothetical protein JCM19237_5016 [Photobacterium aphoticum]|nr:hypothetical protein JCM19237_5016 [Photobacterium aphoticum]
MRKGEFEERFTQMVGAYNKEKETLDSLTEGTPEYTKQKKLCDSLFEKAERFINMHQ